MRVLEVGPWDFPVEKYLLDAEVEEYVATELGVWEGSSEGECSIQAFESAIRRIGLPRSVDLPWLSFYKSPASGIYHKGFDRIFAGNVFGDPRAIPKNPEGSFKFNGSEEAILARALAEKITKEGSLEVLETYTPIRRDILLELLGSHGLGLTSIVEGLDLVDLVHELYPYSGSVMESRLRKEVRLKAARRHGLENGVDEPYLATFGTV